MKNLKQFFNYWRYLVFILGCLFVIFNFYAWIFLPIKANFYLALAKKATDINKPINAFNLLNKSILLKNRLAANFIFDYPELFETILRADQDDGLTDEIKLKMLDGIFSYSKKQADKHPIRLREANQLIRMATVFGAKYPEYGLNNFYLAREIVITKMMPLSPKKAGNYFNLALVAANLNNFYDALYYINQAQKLNSNEIKAEEYNNFENFIKQQWLKSRQISNDDL